MDSMKNVILDLERKNLLLSPEQRQQLRVWCEDEAFLKNKGPLVAEFLTDLNKKEETLFRDIAAQDPHFLKNFEEKYHKGIRTKLKTREKGQRRQELEDIDTFLEASFEKLSE